MTYTLTALDNGLRVASEKLPGAESVAVVVTVNTGARHETLKENGIAHLLEHMAFKGTKTRSAKDIAEAFDNVGGQFNAYTSLEFTVYYAKLLKTHLRLAVDILCDILQNSLFDEGELKREQDVVCQELAMHFDTPDDLIFDYVDATAFPDQPLGRSILGTEESVNAHTRSDLIHFMREHYAPKQMVLSAAGNVEHEALLALVRECFRVEGNAAAPITEPARYGGGQAVHPRSLEQLHCVLALPGVGVHDADFYPWQLYSNILGGGMSSRLFQEVREKRGLAYTVYASNAAFSDTGLTSIYTATGAEKAPELLPMLGEELRKMTNGVEERELNRAKNQSTAELLMARENPTTVATWIGRHLHIFGQYMTVDVITQRINAVTLEDIRRVATRLVHSTPTLAALGPTQHLPHYDDVVKMVKA